MPIAIFREQGTHLVIRYSTGGQYTFKRFISTATDEQIYDLARNLNSFQECNAEKILKVHSRAI
jgi:hypothetical protein